MYNSFCSDCDMKKDVTKNMIEFYTTEFYLSKMFAQSKMRNIILIHKVNRESKNENESQCSLIIELWTSST